MNKSDKKKYIKIAKDLLYSDEIIHRLQLAETENECIRILHDARKGKEQEGYEMSVEQMRAYVIKVYDNPTWRNKVAKMRDGQIIAIYNSFREKGKLKV